MAGQNLGVNTDQVAEIASNIESLNQKLSEQLYDAKATIDSITGFWTGDAAETTKTAFDQFAAKYFQDYEDIINQYVTFLRDKVQQGYFEAETKNINRSESI